MKLKAKARLKPHTHTENAPLKSYFANRYDDGHQQIFCHQLHCHVII